MRYHSEDDPTLREAVVDTPIMKGMTLRKLPTVSRLWLC